VIYSEFADSIRREVAVEGHCSDVELVGDIADDRVVSLSLSTASAFLILLSSMTRGSQSLRACLLAAASPVLVFCTTTSRWNSSKAAVM
jgi:hypothetical protein